MLMTGTVRMTGTVLLNECYKQIILLWSYRFNFLTETFMIGFLFIASAFSFPAAARRLSRWRRRYWGTSPGFSLHSPLGT